MDTNEDNGDEPQKYPCKGCGKVYKHQPSRSKHENKCELAKAVRVKLERFLSVLMNGVPSVFRQLLTLVGILVNVVKGARKYMPTIYVKRNLGSCQN